MLEETKDPAKTPTERIMDNIMPALVHRMVEKEKDYGDAYRHLGSRGQFSDINRKYWKLKRAVWDEKELVGEDVDEILDDIIAHCLLMKLCRLEGI